jgi:hypothetical protein
VSRTPRACVLLLALLAGAGRLVAQQEQRLEPVELRVTVLQPGCATVDRGADDGLAEGDRVLFYPRAGGVQEGTVLRVGPRSAEVELADPAFAPPPGTRGQALVPSSRLAPPVPPESGPPAQAGEPKAVAEHAPWPERDDGYQEGEPLLARVRPLRPDQRPARTSGRVYTVDDFVASSEDDRESGLYRLGAETLYENTFGHGERIHLAGELSYRHTDVPDDDDERDTTLRVDRLSYEWGGTRFEDTAWEVGRFLQNGMPELGVLDGVEWGQRRADGDRYGFSAGFLPEPDFEYQSWADLQFAGYYRWVYDESERFSAAAAYQKSFHHDDADRDLLLGQLSYLPLVGWTFLGTAWVDLYTDSDTAKGPGLGLTQVYARAGHRWARGSTLDLVYTHLAFPDVERNEFRFLPDDELRANHSERLALDLRTPLTERSRLRSQVAAWIDEDEEGGDALLALAFEDALIERGLLDLAVYGTGGDYSSTLGARASLGRRTEHGTWRLDYDFASHHLYGFGDDNDDLPQHRLRGARDFHGERWSFSGYAEVGLWDDENSVAVGFFLERRF